MSIQHNEKVKQHEKIVTAANKINPFINALSINLSGLSMDQGQCKSHKVTMKEFRVRDASKTISEINNKMKSLGGSTRERLLQKLKSKLKK